MIHLYIYFFIIYIDKFWFYIFIRIYILFGGIKENKGPRRAWSQSDTRIRHSNGVCSGYYCTSECADHGEPGRGAAQRVMRWVV